MKTHSSIRGIQFALMLFVLLISSGNIQSQTVLEQDDAIFIALETESLNHVASAINPPASDDVSSQAIEASQPKEKLGYFTQGNVFIQDSLNIGLQNGAVGYRLSVDGKIMCEELKVQNSTTWPDYVFASEYDMLSLEELEQYIAQHQHLPNIPSANEVDANGILVGDLQSKMLEKIEELTLYIIAQDKRIEELEAKAEEIQTQTQAQTQPVK